MPELSISATDYRSPPDDSLLSRSRIDRIQISRQIREFRGSNRTTGFEGWVRLNDCPRSLVVDMDTNCRVRQVYSRGMCNVPGAKSFD